MPASRTDPKRTGSSRTDRNRTGRAQAGRGQVSTKPAPPPSPAETTSYPGPFPRLLPWVLVVGGAIGGLAALVLAIEKTLLLADPTYEPSCSVNPVLSCGSIMTTWQAELFGFPNPFIGMLAFPVVTAIGVFMLAGSPVPKHVWYGLQVGAIGGIVFVHWLAWSSLYDIGALCPYCMVVWIVTITIGWYVTLTTLSARRPALGRRLVRWHGLLLTAWLLAIATLALVRFADEWQLMIG